MARPGRAKAAKFAGATVDDGEIDIAKADDPVAVLGLGDADRLAGERLTEEDELAAPFDLAGGADAAHGMLGIVPGFGNALGIGPRRWLVAARRRLLAERLMQAEGVVERDVAMPM